MDKTGIALITCNREDYFVQALESIPTGKFDKIYVVDASDPDAKYAEKYRAKYGFKLVNCNKRVVVGVAKNKGLQAMIKDGCVHLFLMEDDVLIKNEDIAEKYLTTANTTGIWGTLAHSGHGDANRDLEGVVTPRNSVTYDNGVGLDLFLNSGQPFVYIHKNIITHVGMFDPFYQNAIEHLDHFRAQQELLLTTYYWWFPSPANCEDDMGEIDTDFEEHSVIRKDPEWKANLQKGAEHFIKKFKFSPFNMPIATDEQMLERLDYLETNYANKL